MSNYAPVIITYGRILYCNIVISVGVGRHNFILIVLITVCILVIIALVFYNRDCRDHSGGVLVCVASVL